MELRISVFADGIYWNGGASIVVPEPMARAFESLKTTDSALLGMAFTEHLPVSKTVKTVMKVREDAAKYIAEALTRALLAEMAKHDLHNGYAEE